MSELSELLQSVQLFETELVDVESGMLTPYSFIKVSTIRIVIEREDLAHVTVIFQGSFLATFPRAVIPHISTLYEP